MEYAEEEIRFGRVFDGLRTDWWKILLLSFAVGAISFMYTLTRPNLYEASATIVPASEEGKPAFSIGALATSIGLVVGGPTKLEDLEALINSREISVRVFRKHNLWPIIAPDDYDPDTGKLNLGWVEKLKGSSGGSKEPGDWDAIRAVNDMLDVTVDRKAKTLIIAFESRSAEGSRDIVLYFLDEAKNRLQETALERANRNKKFIEEQIGKTVDPIIRDRLYSLYSQEVEREMLARNREQFGFTILDPPMVPDRKSRPIRTRISLAATVVALPVWCIVFSVLRRKQANEYRRT